MTPKQIAVGLTLAAAVLTAGCSSGTHPAPKPSPSATLSGAQESFVSALIEEFPVAGTPAQLARSGEGACNVLRSGGTEQEVLGYVAGRANARAYVHLAEEYLCPAYLPPAAPSPSATAAIHLIPDTRPDRRVCRHLMVANAGAAAANRFMAWSTFGAGRVVSNHSSGKLINGAVRWFSDAYQGFGNHADASAAWAAVSEDCQSIGVWS